MGKRAYSPRDVVKRSYRSLPWGEKWREVFGEVPDNEMWFISGASAGGKSSFVMQLARELTEHGTVLYGSYEEGVSQSFSERLQRERMTERQGRFRVVTDDTYEELTERLSRPKSAKFVIIDSFQESGLTYEQTLELKRRFPRKTFIYVSQEYKGEPAGKPAVRLKYKAGVKIKVSGHQAVSQGRFAVGGRFTIWDEGVMERTASSGENAMEQVRRDRLERNIAACAEAERMNEELRLKRQMNL